MAYSSKTKAKAKSVKPTKPVEYKYFGFFQYINFGKYKGKTVYQIANGETDEEKKDYEYLRWLLREHNDQRKGFKLSDGCLDNVNSALRSEEEGGTWVYCKEDTSNPNERIVYYETETGLKSNPMKYVKCSQCDKFKHCDMYLPNTKICKTCT